MNDPQAAAERKTADGEERPPVALIVPVTGRDPGLGANLESLADQNYGNYRLILACQDRTDPAWGEVLRLAESRDRVVPVQAGRATGCAQKNFNLLAGVAAAGDDPRILVFADATRRAAPDWLGEMVRPMVEGGARVVSGYHRIRSIRPNLAVAIRAQVVNLLSLAKLSPALNQTWGGATAITRELFEELAAVRLWSRAVVDDVSLAARLRKHRVRTFSTRAEPLETRIEADSWPRMWSWLVRQIAFLRYYFHPTWVFGLVAFGVGWAAWLGGLIAWLEAVGQGRRGWPVILGWLFPMVYLLVGEALRRFRPSGIGPFRWALGAVLLPGIVFLAWLTTGGPRRIRWRGRVYEVDRRGRVIRERVPGQNA